MQEFPSDFWRWAGLPNDEEALLEGEGWIPKLEERFGAPREFSIVERFLPELPRGRILLYGAGAHSRHILPWLRRIPGLDIVAVVDRLATDRPTFEGLTVIPPSGCLTQSFDYILVGHPLKEPEMIEQLEEHGVPLARIFPLYTGPEYATFAKQFDLDYFGVAPRKIDVALVTASLDPNRTIPDEALQAYFPRDRTVDFYIGTPATRDEIPAGVYETVPLAQSLTLLDRALEAFSPCLVWVRGGPPFWNFRSLYLRVRHPNVVFVSEFVDFTSAWGTPFLRAGNLPENMFRVLRLSEFHALNRSDLVVSKSGGRYWDEVLRHARSAYALYFPQMTVAPVSIEPRKDNGEIRVLYAGQVPIPKGATTEPFCYNFLPVMEATCRMGGVTIDLYNSSHAHATDQNAFREFFQIYAKGPISYHSRIPYTDLMKLARNYHYGWLCDDFTGLNADRYYVAANRFTGYISAGLPVIIDASWRFQAELLEKFNAGIVVNEMTPGTIHAALHNADHERMLDGVRRLRDYMIEHNREILDHVERLASTTVDTAR